MIVGSGSASFEMLRHLVERLPVMVTPRWVNTWWHVYDVGGPEVMTYLDMMETFASVTGLRRRLVVKVPVLTARLSSHWVNLFTPVPYGLAKPLVDSLADEVVVRPGARPRGGDVVARRRPARPGPRRPVARQPRMDGRHAVQGRARRARRGEPGAGLRGAVGDRRRAGWPSFMWAWRIRGGLDRLIGGVGLRRGRRDPEELRVGDALDLCRVEEPTRGGEDGQWLLRLRAEMKLPGQALLEFRIAGRGRRC